MYRTYGRQSVFIRFGRRKSAPGGGVTSLSRSKASHHLPRTKNRPVGLIASGLSSWRRRSQQAILQRHKYLDVIGEVAPKVQHQAAGMFDELRCPVHDLLQYRLEPPALGRMANRRNLARQPQLAQEAQAVVRERRQVHDGIVGVELARGQALQIEIGLDLRVELLMRAVAPVQVGDRFRLEVEAGPNPRDLALCHGANL